MIENFDKIEIGQKAELSHKMTEEDVQKFSDLTGDNNPLHMDEAYAARTSFKKRIVHGMLAASFISTLIGTKLPGTGALWLSQTLRFLTPLRIGDTIKVIAQVTHKSITQRIIMLKINTFNQSGQKVLEGEAKVKILKEAKEEEKMEDDNKGAAIVTGASRGIGSAIALKLAEDGFGVLINYRSSKEEADEVLNKIIEMGGQGCVFQADVRNYDDVEKMVHYTLEQFGRIDVLVNNATGKIAYQAFDQIKWEDIQEHLDTQIKGAFNTSKLVIPIMVSQKKGKIINIGSIFSDNTPPLKMYSYVIAKSALSSFTKSLASEFGPKGLNINCVSPGMTETTLIADVPEKTKMITEMQTPLRRLAKPRDVANVVSFLASDAANYLTGETVRVCGGQLMI